MRTFPACTLLAIFTIAASTSRADVTVCQSPTCGNSVVFEYVDVSEDANGFWTVVVACHGTPGGTLVVEADDSNDPIAPIFVEVTTAQNVSLLVRPHGGSSGAVTFLGDILSSPDSVGDLWISTVTVAGNVGDPDNPNDFEITAQSIDTLTATGDIAAKITSTGSTLTSSAGGITLIKSTGGRILGDISAKSAIVEINAAGNIGTSGGLVNIYSGVDGVANAITNPIQKVIGDAIYANIDAKRSGTNSDVYYVLTTVGEFKGSLNARSLFATPPAGLDIKTDLDANVKLWSLLREPIIVRGAVASGTTIAVGQVLDDNSSDDGRFAITGDMNGTITVAGALDGVIDVGGAMAGALTVTGSVNQPITVGGVISGTIKVGDSLSGNVTTSTNSGLSGQVIINANSGSGAWNARVTVPTTTSTILLDPSLGTAPYYSVSSDSLGGGAVGLARFTFHEYDSSPVDDSTVSGTVTHADMAMYGPVVVVSGTGSIPVKVERRLVLLSTWSDVSSSYTASVVDAALRVVRVVPNSGSFSGGYQYRITPRQGSGEKRLVCDLASQPTPLEGRPIGGGGTDLYSFTVEIPIEELDASGDGVLDEYDIAEWLAKPTDLDGDGVTTDDDLKLLQYLIDTKE